VNHEDWTLAQELQLGADRITNLILHTELEWIDILIEIDSLRERCRDRAPEKLPLFEAIYVSRFSRLWEQWRLEGDTSWTWRRGGPEAAEGWP